MKRILLLLLFPLASLAQSGTMTINGVPQQSVSDLVVYNVSVKLPAAQAITAYRPITTFGNAGQVAPQAGSSSIYGVSTTGAAVGQNVLAVTSGSTPCEFDSAIPSPITQTLTAVPFNGMCHWDASIVSDSDVCAPNGVIGRILYARPDLGPNFAQVTVAFPGRKGTKQTASCISDFATSAAAAAPVSSVANKTGAVTLFAADVSGLAAVATSGSYSDLANKPSIPGGTVTGVTAASPLQSSGGTAPAISCPSCLTAIPSTLVGTATITGTITIGLLAGVQTQTITVAGVVTGGSYLIVPSASPTAGFAAFSGALGVGANSLRVFVWSPAVSVLTNYSIPVNIYRLQ